MGRPGTVPTCMRTSAAKVKAGHLAARGRPHRQGRGVDLLSAVRGHALVREDTAPTRAGPDCGHGAAGTATERPPERRRSPPCCGERRGDGTSLLYAGADRRPGQIQAGGLTSRATALSSSGADTPFVPIRTDVHLICGAGLGAQTYDKPQSPHLDTDYRLTSARSRDFRLGKRVAHCVGDPRRSPDPHTNESPFLAPGLETPAGKEFTDRYRTELPRQESSQITGDLGRS